VLECETLWLGPWLFTQPIERCQRVICAAASREPLGQARWRPGTTLTWLRWLIGPILEVVETEDESLLFTLRRVRGWRASWEVRDADGRLIGSVSPDEAWDPIGRRVARLQAASEGSTRRWLMPEGHDLGTVTSAAEGTLVSFGPFLDGNPFAKMLLLATTLPSTKEAP
jgi:hypothetical protein